jgi:hypothetical protein
VTLRRVHELVWSWLSTPALRGARRPRVTVDTGPAVPAWVLTAVWTVIAIGCTALVAERIGHWVVAAALIAATVVRASDVAPSLVVVGAALLLVTSPPDPFAPRVFLLAFGLHLTVELAALLGDLPWGATVERRVLTGAARPFLTVQATVQVLAVVAAWVGTRPLSASWLPLVAGTALAAAAWGIQARLRDDG